ncbi:MAG TPA: type 1 glutamine amidotransferase [Solirubrobacteraceae bacterium]|nr:type 1 glutamine amidotransferase [Solirubrobacteraceae bacterium]
MRFLVIQHASCEPPGAYEDEMRARDISFERVEVDRGEPLPEWRSFDAIVAMGGPMSATEDRELPWLASEKRHLAEAVTGGLPYWGVCLGAQLLAACLGARVYRGERSEIGVYRDVELTPRAREDTVFAAAPQRITTLQWHSDTFELPPGARLLARSDAYPHQAFAWRRAYGLQFHLEASPELTAEWLEVPAYAEELTRTLGPDGLGTMRAQLGELSSAPALARQLFGRFIDRVVSGDRAEGPARGG